MTADSIGTPIGKPLRSRAMIAYALCLAAEQEIHSGQPDRAKDSMMSIVRIMNDVSLRLRGDGPAVTRDDQLDAAEVLAALADRLWLLETRLGVDMIQQASISTCW